MDASDKATGRAGTVARAGGGYTVLARKFRPDSFEALIGQEPMVRTLRNAFAAGRIAQAWMLTGVRGVGKTTTARILARGLNYETEAGDGAATVDFPATGVHCRAIMEGRHPDVIEIDAASHTGIDDVREIIESARYSPVSARFKIYIVDEVHMLSKPAFNGLLKTLEEPPAHVKFVFATTEIRKVPVTVLSRCQRFDLKRIEAAVLIPHLESIAACEGIAVEQAALALIARAAEGSARDALSILDQAIAHGDGSVTATHVQDMLGLADRTRTIDLFEAVAAGRTADALALNAALHEAGADPVVVLTDLAAFAHYVTRLKVSKAAAKDPMATEAERLRGGEFAEALSLRALSRMWQMLLAGINETAQARLPLAAADMVLVRLCHAADLPTPDEAVRMLDAARGGEQAGTSRGLTPVREAPAGRAGVALAAGPMAAPRAARRAEAVAAANAPLQPAAETAVPGPGTFDELLALARKKRDRLIAFALERHVVPLKVEPGRLDIAITGEAEAELPQRLAAALSEWTGGRWIVSVGALPADRTTRHAEKAARRAADIEAARAEPLVASALEAFPGARIVSVRTIELDAGNGNGTEPEHDGAK